jgi:nitrogen-specific signal transduction histidine kinase
VNVDFKQLVNQWNRPIIITDKKLTVRFLNKKALHDLGAHQAVSEKHKLTDYLQISKADLEFLHTAVTDGLGLRIRVGKKGSRATASDATLNLHGFPVHRVAGEASTVYFELELESSAHPDLSTAYLRGVGRLTGELAHSLSNPLAIVQINCESLELSCQNKESLPAAMVEGKVQKIGGALARVSAETRKLKELSQKLSEEDIETLETIKGLGSVQETPEPH